MIRETIVHTTEAAWLDERKTVTTSTEAAALFGAGVYVKTPYELYHLKAGTFPAPEFEGNERTRWGNRLEAPIAYGIAEDLGLTVEPFKNFIKMPEFFLGASFDFIVTGIVEDFEGENEARELFRKHGRGLLEVKNVDGLQFKRAWIDDGETIEAPVHIEFQVQTQMEVADIGWAIIAPLVGGNTPKPVIRTRDVAAGEAIRTKSLELWQRVNAGAEPEPDFTKDGDTIALVYRDNDGSSVDLSDNARFAELCRAYKSAGADEKAAADRKKAAKAELLTIVKSAKTALGDGCKVTAGTRAPSFRAYYRDAYEKLTVSLSEVKGTQIEAEVPAYRDVRVSAEAA